MEKIIKLKDLLTIVKDAPYKIVDFYSNNVDKQREKDYLNDIVTEIRPITNQYGYCYLRIYTMEDREYYEDEI